MAKEKGWIFDKKQKILTPWKTRKGSGTTFSLGRQTRKRKRTERRSAKVFSW